MCLKFIFCSIWGFFFVTRSGGIDGRAERGMYNKSFVSVVFGCCMARRILTGCLLFEPVGPCRLLCVLLLHATQPGTTPSYIKWKPTVKSTQVNLRLRSAVPIGGPIFCVLFYQGIVVVVYLTQADDSENNATRKMELGVWFLTWER